MIKKNLKGLVDVMLESKLSVFFFLMMMVIIILPNIARESLWVDEIFSAQASLNTSSLHSMFTEYIFKDVHPPLYQVVLYYWGKLFGGSDFSIRIISLVFVLTSIVFSFLMLCKYFPKRVAIIFVALSVFTPGVIYYAQEARSYAMLYSFANIATVLSTIIWVKIKNHVDIEYSLYALYAIIGILLCYTHFFGYILIFSLSLILLIYSIFLHRKGTTLRLLAISLVIAISGILWLLILFNYGDIADNVNGNFWIKNDLYGTFKGVLVGLVFGNRIAPVIWISLVILLIFPLPYFFTSFKKYRFILYPILLVLFVSTIISIHTPITTSRNLIIIIPSALLFLAFIFDGIYDKKKLIIILYLSLLALSATWKSFTYEKQNWKGASQYIQKNFDEQFCKIPIDPRDDRWINVAWLDVLSYYLGAQYSYIPTGPKEQMGCDLIYFEGHKTKEHIENDLEEHNVIIPYEVLDFHRVYVVIKK